MFKLLAGWINKICLLFYKRLSNSFSTKCIFHRKSKSLGNVCFWYYLLIRQLRRKYCYCFYNIQMYTRYYYSSNCFGNLAYSPHERFTLRVVESIKDRTILRCTRHPLRVLPYHNIPRYLNTATCFLLRRRLQQVNLVKLFWHLPEMIKENMINLNKCLYQIIGLQILRLLHNIIYHTSISLNALVKRYLKWI